MMPSQQFSYEHEHNRRKQRVSSRSKEVRERDRFYQSRSADHFDEQQNFHQNSQIENLVKHETISYDDEDDGRADEEPPEDLRRKSNIID